MLKPSDPPSDQPTHNRVQDGLWPNQESSFKVHVIIAILTVIKFDKLNFDSGAAQLVESVHIRRAIEKKLSQKVEKVQNFLDPPPSPRMFRTFLNLGKIGNLMIPPHLDIIWEKF